MKNVRERIEVRADQIVPGSMLVGVGRQMNDRVDPVEMRDPIIVENLQIGRDDVGIVRVGDTIDQHQVVNVGPGPAKLAADIAAGARDEHRARLFFDRIQERFFVGLEFVVGIIIIVVGIEHVDFFRLVDRQMDASHASCPLGLFTRLVMFARSIGRHGRSSSQFEPAKTRSASHFRARPIV